MKELQIIIAGESATGKSTMMLMLEEFLLEKGFNVEVDLANELIDYGTEAKFRTNMSKHDVERIAALRKDIKINIKQKQLHWELKKQ